MINKKYHWHNIFLEKRLIFKETQIPLTQEIKNEISDKKDGNLDNTEQALINNTKTLITTIENLINKVQNKRLRQKLKKSLISNFKLIDKSTENINNIKDNKFKLELTKLKNNLNKIQQSITHNFNTGNLNTDNINSLKELLKNQSKIMINGKFKNIPSTLDNIQKQSFYKNKQVNQILIQYLQEIAKIDNQAVKKSEFKMFTNGLNNLNSFKLNTLEFLIRKRYEFIFKRKHKVALLETTKKEDFSKLTPVVQQDVKLKIKNMYMVKNDFISFLLKSNKTQKQINEKINEIDKNNKEKIKKLIDTENNFKKEALGNNTPDSTESNDKKVLIRKLLENQNGANTLIEKYKEKGIEYTYNVARLVNRIRMVNQKLRNNSPIHDKFFNKTNMINTIGQAIRFTNEIINGNLKYNYLYNEKIKHNFSGWDNFPNNANYNSSQIESTKLEFISNYINDQELIRQLFPDAKTSGLNLINEATNETVKTYSEFQKMVLTFIEAFGEQYPGAGQINSQLAGLMQGNKIFDKDNKLQEDAEKILKSAIDHANEGILYDGLHNASVAWGFRGSKDVNWTIENLFNDEKNLIRALRYMGATKQAGGIISKNIQKEVSNDKKELIGITGPINNILSDGAQINEYIKKAYSILQKLPEHKRLNIIADENNIKKIIYGLIFTEKLHDFIKNQSKINRSEFEKNFPNLLMYDQMMGVYSWSDKTISTTIEFLLTTPLFFPATTLRVLGTAIKLSTKTISGAISKVGNGVKMATSKIKQPFIKPRKPFQNKQVVPQKGNTYEGVLNEKGEYVVKESGTQNKRVLNLKQTPSPINKNMKLMDHDKKPTLQQFESSQQIKLQKPQVPNKGKVDTKINNVQIENLQSTSLKNNGKISVIQKVGLKMNNDIEKGYNVTNIEKIDGKIFITLKKGDKIIKVPKSQFSKQSGVITFQPSKEIALNRIIAITESNQNVSTLHKIEKIYQSEGKTFYTLQNTKTGNSIVVSADMIKSNGNFFKMKIPSNGNKIMQTEEIIRKAESSLKIGDVINFSQATLRRLNNFLIKKYPNMQSLQITEIKLASDTGNTLRMKIVINNINHVMEIPKASLKAMLNTEKKVVWNIQRSSKIKLNLDAKLTKSKATGLKKVMRPTTIKKSEVVQPVLKATSGPNNSVIQAATLTTATTLSSAAGSAENKEKKVKKPNDKTEILYNSENLKINITTDKIKDIFSAVSTYQYKSWQAINIKLYKLSKNKEIKKNELINFGKEIQTGIGMPKAKIDGKIGPETLLYFLKPNIENSLRHITDDELNNIKNKSWKDNNAELAEKIGFKNFTKKGGYTSLVFGRLIQEVVGVAQKNIDGKVGPHTLSKIKEFNYQ